MTRRVPKSRYFRSAHPNRRYRVDFDTADAYMADVEDYVPGSIKGLAYYFTPEVYDPTFDCWDDRGPTDYGLCATARAALEGPIVDAWRKAEGKV
jgi:hypothetical protein